MRSLTRALALILLLAMLTLPLGACGAVNKPLRYVKKATLKAIEESTLGQIAEVLRESVADGSLSASFSGATGESGLSAGALTAYFSPQADRIVLDGSMTLAGKTYDAAFFMDKESIVMRSTAFLGSSTLGITLDTLQRDIATSIFRNNSGTPYADPGVDDATAGEISSFVESFFALYADAEDVAELAEDALDTLLAALEEHASSSYYRRDGRIYVTVSVENGALSKALRETRSQLISSKKFCRRLRSLAKEYDTMRSAVGGVVTDTYAQRVEEFLGNDAGVEELCSKIDRADPFVLRLEATVHALSRTAERFSLSLLREGTPVRAFSFDHTAEDVFLLSLLLPDGERTLSLRGISDSRREYRADVSFSLTAGDESHLSEGAFYWDKKNGSYTLTLCRAGETRTVTGDLQLSDEHWRLSVDRVCVGETELSARLSLEATVGAEAPATPAYSELFTMDSNRFRLINDILAPAKAQLEADAEGLEDHYREIPDFLSGLLGLEGMLPELSFPELSCFKAPED